MQHEAFEVIKTLVKVSLVEHAKILLSSLNSRTLKRAILPSHSRVIAICNEIQFKPSAKSRTEILRTVFRHPRLRIFQENFIVHEMHLRAFGS